MNVNDNDVVVGVNILSPFVKEDKKAFEYVSVNNFIQAHMALFNCHLNFHNHEVFILLGK